MPGRTPCPSCRALSRPRAPSKADVGRADLPVRPCAAKHAEGEVALAGADNRPGPTGSASNREGPTGQGRVKQPENDLRLAGNRGGPTGQGQIRIGAEADRLSETGNAPKSAHERWRRPYRGRYNFRHADDCSNHTAMHTKASRSIMPMRPSFPLRGPLAFASLRYLRIASTRPPTSRTWPTCRQRPKAVENGVATKFAKCCHQRCHGEKGYRGNCAIFALTL